MKFKQGNRIMFSVKDGDIIIECRGIVMNIDDEDLIIQLDTKFIGQSKSICFEIVSIPKTVADQYLVLLNDNEDRKTSTPIE